MRYRLDDLGWFNFEKLTQALLKASLGLGVESWGGSGDHGRDAYCGGPLCFPSRHEESAGPFLFQAKFVQNANAAGADWVPAVRGAVQKELRSLARRRSKAAWTEPAHYVLLSNVPLTANTREELEQMLGASLPRARITLCGGEDICSLLDNEPALRRSYPEILSLRDLDGLLHEAVSRGILERSAAAIEESRDLVPTFVPTRAYHDALRALKEHSFAVLDGPPEVGKTAIARTIALAYLMDDWHAVDCRTSDDFFSAYSPGERQIFVVDDAFGRTEYDPTLGHGWERDLARVLCRVNATHHLIWTTRQHILARALRTLDLAGRAERFPAPAEVLVTASALTREEKARMLYRHCRAVQLDERSREIIRKNATVIVDHHDFTPERIRRFACDSLPELAGSIEGLDAAVLRQHIDHAIRHPTRRMRLAFRALGPEHKAVLLAMLESGGPATRRADRYGIQLGDRYAIQLTDLAERALAYCPTRPVASCLDDLLGTFLRARTAPEGIQWVRWIHPSYRDLVIDELASDPGLTQTFLQGASVAGIALALSRAGGAAGERDLPLLQTADAWDALVGAYARLADHDPYSLEEIGDQLSRVAAETDSPFPERVRPTARNACTKAATIMRSAWERGSLPLTVHVLETYFRLIAGASFGLRRPEVGALWESTLSRARLQFGNGVVPETGPLGDAMALCAIVEKEYPELASRDEFASARNEISSGILDRAKELSEWGPDSDGDDGAWYEHAAATTGRLADLVDSMPGSGEHETLIEELRAASDQFSAARQAWEEHQGPSDEPDRYEYQGHGEGAGGLRALTDALFDVPALFKDL